MKTQIMPISSPYVITANNLSIIFDGGTDDELVVLKNFNYKFEKNKIYFIIGNSGSGKTTLLGHFNGLLKSKHGDLKVGTIDILAKQRKIHHFKQLRKYCSMVMQFPEYQLFKDTIEKDVIFGPINLGEKKQEAKIKALKYLKIVGLDESFLKRSPFDLSGGQKRRVAIAGILAIEPEILMFDEPTAGLDPAGENEMIKIITDLHQQGKTIIIVTHVMDQVLQLADEVLVLDNKQLLAHGDPYSIFTNQQIVKNTTLDIPNVIRAINSLVEMNPKFKKLYDLKPRNVEQLGVMISQILGSKNE